MNRHVTHLVPFILVLLLFFASSTQPALAQGSTDISVTITANRDKARPGQLITYTVVATNLGPDDAIFVDVVHRLPDQLQFISLTCDKGTSPDTPACEYTTLAAGESATSILVATPRADPGKHPKLVTTTAHIVFETTDSVDPDTSNNAASVAIKLIGK
jgi:uncharacterized repeat protein (TIGR01451 family)